MQPVRLSSLVVAGAVACLSVLMTACSPPITEQQILSILEATDKAIREKNPDALLAHVSETATIKVSIRGTGSPQSMSFGPKEYKEYLEEGFRAAQEDTYTRKDTKVAIAPNGRTGKASYQVVEIVNLGGLSISAVSQVEVAFETRNGTLLKTAIDASMEMPFISGVQALKEHKPRKALDYFRTAVTHTPSFAAAHGLRGAAAELLGEFDEALDAYRTTVQLQPSPDTHLRLGMLAERMGNTSLAVQSMQAALSATEHGREEVAVYLFRILVESGDRAGALSLAQARGWVRAGADYCDPPQGDISVETWAFLAMLIHPRRADCLLPVGMALTEDGLVGLARLVLLDRIQNSQDRQVRQKAEAFLRYRLPAQDVAKQAESLNIVGYNLDNRFKNTEEAIRVYQKAIAADPHFSWPYHNIGRVLLDRGQIMEAMEWYRAAVTVNPNHWKAQYNLGWVALELKRYDEALSAFRQAVVLNPENADGHFNLGRALLSVGREEEGIQELRIAVQLDPHVREYPAFPRDKL